MTPAIIPVPVPSGGPTLGLALGADGARGLAHIPVIEALDEMGIRPAAIAGSSIGAIIGAGMAAGMTGRDIRDYTLETVGKRSALANRLWSLGPATMRDAVGGFRLGQFNLERILGAFLPERLPEHFSGLEIPLKVVATDYFGQTEVVCESGDLRNALAASAAIPALFMPVRLGGRFMIDGGIYNPVPYDHPADIVIGVDVIGGPAGDDGEPPNRIDSLFGASQLMMQANLALKQKLSPPDILLRPDVNSYRVLDFLKARQILDTAEALKDDLKRRIEARMEDVVRK